MIELVAADIGGTHARFALASVDGGRVVRISAPATLRTADHDGLASAWRAFAALAGRTLPVAASIAAACTGSGPVLRMINNGWEIEPGRLNETLGVERHLIVNDFAAIAHAIDQLPVKHFRTVQGPDQPLPAQGSISILGPGTGLGVAQLLRRPGGSIVLDSEGAHAQFGPVDPLETAILEYLRGRFGRVSIERLTSGPGLGNLYATLASFEGQPLKFTDDRSLWAGALAGEDPLAVAALDRFCLILGSVAGDLALIHNAQAVIIAGGLGPRLADRLAAPAFAERFRAKGRFTERMATIPVQVITYPEPGLFGAAAAFAAHDQGA